MIISGLVKSSLVDFPGLVSCILFLPGCNYNCFYCHNRSLIDGTHEIIDNNEIKLFLKKRRGMIDGVVITGGEPTLQPDLKQYIKMLKDMDYKVKLDSNGSDPKLIEEFLKEKLVDYFAIDYKAPAARYEEICGEDAHAYEVLETIGILLKNNADFEVRTTVIPQFSENDLIQMAKELPILPRYVLNRYRQPEKYLPCDKERIEKRPYTQSDIEVFVKKLKEYQPNITT